MINKETLPVIYRHQKNAWVDATIFKDLFQNHIVPMTKEKLIDLFTDSDAIFEMSIWQCIMVYSGYMKSKQTRYRTT